MMNQSSNTSIADIEKMLLRELPRPPAFETQFPPSTAPHNGMPHMVYEELMSTKTPTTPNDRGRGYIPVFGESVSSRAQISRA
jgi:hypothetical protein